MKPFWNQFIAGAVTLGSWTIALFFYRFWHRTRDTLFFFFSLAFFLFGIERLVLVSFSADSEFRPYIYTIRLVSFLLIVFAILNKNRAKT
jgi:hypothetical protein